MKIELQKVQSSYDNATAKSTIPYDNTTAKCTIQLWQYNCKKCNIRMTIQLQKVQYTYDNRTAKGTIDV